MTQPDTDPFDGHEPLPGRLASLGRHIRDASGQPSGSPANFEALRGKSYENLPTAEDAAEVIAALEAEFGELA